MRELVHLKRPGLAELRRAAGETAQVSYSQMRCLNVSVEMRFLFVLIGTLVANVLSYTSMVSFVQHQVTTSGELFFATRHVTLDVFAGVESHHVRLKGGVLSKAFRTNLADERLLPGMDTCNSGQIRILFIFYWGCLRRWHLRAFP